MANYHVVLTVSTTADLSLIKRYRQDPAADVGFLFRIVRSGVEVCRALGLLMAYPRNEPVGVKMAPV